MKRLRDRAVRSARGAAGEAACEQGDGAEVGRVGGPTRGGAEKPQRGSADKMPGGSAEKMQGGSAEKPQRGGAEQMPGGSAEQMPGGGAEKLPGGRAEKPVGGRVAKLAGGRAEKPARGRVMKQGGGAAEKPAQAPKNVFQRAQAQFRQRGSRLYFDLSPLREAHWTGIPVVAAGLCGALLDTLPEFVSFFDGYELIGTDFVADAVARNTGLFLDRDIKRGYAKAGKLPLAGGAGPSVGLFPSVKPLRRAFDVEASIFHDLSTLTMPLLHIRGNVMHHMDAILADIASNDFSITVSEASRADLSVYLGVSLDEIVAVPNGAAWPGWFAALADNAGASGVEPYFLILGTREPRKNIMKVFDLLEARPDLLAGHRFVFAGKMGWLEEQHALPRSLEPFVQSGRISFTGFVTEAEKYSLLRHARATLYPSLFEGFGLPVLESLSVGTPCVASWSSSIPEVGGDVCAYFDPFSVQDFARAVDEIVSRRSPELEQACRVRAQKFTWRLALARILDRVLQLEVFAEGDIGIGAGGRSDKSRAKT